MSNGTHLDISKSEVLEIIKLLSALESWTFSLKQTLPDYLSDSITMSISSLSDKLLED